MTDYLQEIVKKQKSGIPAGIVSVCTANRFALSASMLKALEYKMPVLIEATANQVDQNGGYTGMTPSDFITFVKSIADDIDFPEEQIIYGGDHLGPLTKKDLNEEEAMTYAEKLVYEYVIAGFTKIHLDTSMRLASDPADQPLADSVIAERGARLCRMSEDAFAERKKSHPESKPPVYIIGSEVPIPGGTQSEEEESQITSPEDCKKTYNTYKEVFSRNGLDNAFERVIAIVVQTGVEFGDNDIFEYNSEKAVSLTEYGKKNLPIIFEGHSTDYQSESSLRAMIEDGIAFLKVGPALTFALREALFSLEMMEKEIYFGTTWNASNFSEVLESAMLANPGYWQNHYHGDELSQRFARKYSFSDRARYYLNESSVKESVKCLIGNINKANIHLSILSQFFPRELFELMRCKKVFSAEDIINTYIGFYLDDYYRALMPFNKPINGGSL